MNWHTEYNEKQHDICSSIAQNQCGTNWKLLQRAQDSDFTSKNVIVFFSFVQIVAVKLFIQQIIMA